MIISAASLSDPSARSSRIRSLVAAYAGDDVDRRAA